MEFYVELDSLLQNRMFYNVPLNYNEESIRYYVACTTPYGIYYTYVNKADTECMVKFNAVKNYCNIPVNFMDRRVVSHDFGNITTWLDPADSLFKYQPPANQKFLMLSMRARFPRNIALTEANALQFKFNKYVPQYSAVVPALAFEYKSITDMLKQSDSPINSTTDVIPNLGSIQMVEVEFTYTNVNSIWMSPLQLRGSLGESITIGTKANQPLLDVSGDPLVGACWMLMTGRLVPDF